MTLNLKCPYCGYTETVHDERSAWVALYVQRQEAHERTRRKLPNAEISHPAGRKE